MKKIFKGLTSVFLCISIFCSLSITAFASSNINISEDTIFDEISEYGDDYYTVRDGNIILSTDVLIKKSERIIKKYNYTLEYIDKVVSIYQTLETEYNKLLDKNIIKVTDNGTFYLYDDNEACVQGGNVNKTILKFGVLYQLLSSSNCPSRASKYRSAQSIFLEVYRTFDQMTDKNVKSAFKKFADDAYGGFADTLLATVAFFTASFTNEMALRCANVSTYIMEKKNNYGVSIRTNAGLTMKVAAQSTSITADNAYGDAYKLNYKEA